MKPGESIELVVTPDPDVARRYSDASGDLNPIHLDAEIARSVGLPGPILHGLWTMAQVARLHTEVAGGPETLRCLEVSFRAAGMPGEQISVTTKVRAVEDGVATLDCEVRQNGRRIIRDGIAEIVVPEAASAPVPRPDRTAVPSTSRTGRAA